MLQDTSCEPETKKHAAATLALLSTPTQDDGEGDTTQAAKALSADKPASDKMGADGDASETGGATGVAATGGGTKAKARKTASKNDVRPLQV